MASMIHEWTALLAIIVEKYPNLCGTIEKCVLTTINRRPHANHKRSKGDSHFLRIQRPKNVAGHTDHVKTETK
jgi:hypothetical protein